MIIDTAKIYQIMKLFEMDLITREQALELLNIETDHDKFIKRIDSILNEK